MKRWIKSTLAVALVATLAAGAVRVISARQTQKNELDAQQAATKIQAELELGSSDLVQVKTVDLTQGLAISGTLKAVNTAIIKARVPGEIQGLSVREGDAVKSGDIIARIESTEYLARLSQMQQQAEAAKAQVDIAKRSFDNNRSLVDQGFISKTALDASLATLAAAEANYRAARAGADVSSKALDDTVLRAPVSGQVSQRLVQSGERVSVDARLVEIVDLSRMELEASISAADSLQVRVGQTAQLTLEGASKPLPAQVSRINPSAIAGSRAVLIYLSVEHHSTLRQGLFAQGTLSTGRTRSLAVPLSTVRTDRPQPYLQLLREGQVQHHTVTLGGRGESDGQILVAIDGVDEGAMVLSGNVGSIRAGTLVKRAAGTK